MPALCALALALCACSDGGSHAERDNNPPAGETALLTGHITPMPVAGLAYTSDSHSGTTDSSGTFQYQSGETLTFRLGDTTLGQATGAGELSLLDITGAQELSDVRQIQTALGDANHPYSAAANLIRLLQSLDADNDPSNGIVIDEQTRTGLAGMSLNLAMTATPFAAQPALRQRLTDLGRPLRRLEVALALHYQVAGTELSVDGTRLSRQRSQQTTALNTQAGALTARSEFTYDPWGNRLTSVTWDEHNKRKHSSRYRYDQAGQRIHAEHSEYDGNGNSRINFSSRSQRDISGFATETVYDYRNDNPRQDRTVSMRDERGNTVRIEEDRNNDGSIDLLTLSTFLDSGQRAGSERDSDGDGSIDTVSSYHYDARERLTRSTYRGSEQDIDGAVEGSPPLFGTGPVSLFDPRTPYPERRPAFLVGGSQEPLNRFTRDTRFEWTADGRLARRTTDSNDDGLDDKITTFAYNSAGQLSAWTYDRDGDGGHDSFANYTYNDAGQLTRVEQQDGRYIFGTLRETRTLFYNEDGRLARLVVTGNSTPFGGTEQHFFYDRLGNVNRTDTDQDGDGTQDVRSDVEWEASFRLDDWPGYQPN
ncbi:hypothetical protein [Parahaliea mediterranea]|uniref:hypothetical protein n=1 Tax=Parahaliea mediterranea TaxID=651086 RepID=UPI000E2F9C90|nr:hypothetical protein [Parahaliea mediterranea]